MRCEYLILILSSKLTSVKCPWFELHQCVDDGCSFSGYPLSNSAAGRIRAARSYKMVIADAFRPCEKPEHILAIGALLALDILRDI